MFKIARKMKGEHVDIVGEKCIRDHDGNLALSDQDKLTAWKAHYYDKLLNEEFPWNNDSLSQESPVQGPPIYIIEEIVHAAIRKMKTGKAAGPSGIIVEMIRAAEDEIITPITLLVNRIIYEVKIPEDWDLSYIINFFKGKGDALSCGNYRGLKLQEQLMKILEHILDDVIRKQVDIDSMQFGFMPGRGTTDAVFILRQLQEKYLSKRKNTYFAFVDLGKAFDRVPRSALWWSMRKLGVEEWIISVVRSMYENAQSRVRINNLFSEAINVTVGVHQGSVLSPLLFVIVMEALSGEFRVGCPWELLYADDLAITAETLDSLRDKLKKWKDVLELKGLKVNIGKTKITCSSHDAKKPIRKSANHPCGVCYKGVGANSIFCNHCKHWVHKKCSGLKGRLHADLEFKCKSCSNVASSTPIIHLPEVKIDMDTFEVVPSFCYLGDMIGQTGGCEDAITARIRTAWKAFHELLPILTNRGISLRIRGYLFGSCVRSAMLYASETWPVTTEDVTHLVRCDNAMIRWICGVKLSQHIPTDVLRKRMGIMNIEENVRWGRLRFYGHLCRQEDNTWPKKIFSIIVEGKYPCGRPKMRWMDVIRNDLKKKGIKEDLAWSRDAWRRAIKPQMTQQEGLQPT